MVIHDPKQDRNDSYIYRMTKFNPRDYWEQRLAGSQGLEGVGYLGLGQLFNSWMYRLRRSIFRRTVRRHMPEVSAAHVLDVGSGTGEYIRTWQSLGVASVCASDLTDAAVSGLRAEWPSISLLRVDIADPGVEWERAYDAVSCMDVLFHVVDDVACRQALINLRKALRDGGLLFISENFVHVARGAQVHFTQRTLSAYSALLEEAGFRIVERRPMFHLMNAPVDSRSPWLHRWWNMVMAICRRSPRAGGFLAMVVYPLEWLLVSTRREGVSTELMVCETLVKRT